MAEKIRLSQRSRLKHPIYSRRFRACAVAIFARAPSPGRAKTRLIPLLGAQGAANFQAALIADTLRKVATRSRHAARYLFVAGRSFPVPSALARFTVVHQHGADLGERLVGAFRQLLARHQAAVVIGTDSPALPARNLHQARRELSVCDAVLGPCPDGGFYLIGLRCLPAGLFRKVRWGSRFAFRDVLRNLLRNGLACSVLDPIPDVDRPADVHAVAAQLARRPGLRRSLPALWGFLKVSSGAGTNWAPGRPTR